MKKILAMVVALSTVSAFAGMVSFDFKDYVSNSGTVFSPKFSYNTEGGAGATSSDDKTTMAFGLNYAHELANGGQVQILFSRTSVDNGSKDGSTMTYGVGYIHNMGELANATYFAGRIMMRSSDNDDSVDTATLGAKDAEWTIIQLEAGKRFKAFSTGSYNWSYSPSVTLTQTAENKEAGDETDMSIALNLLKFDVLF